MQQLSIIPRYSFLGNPMSGGCAGHNDPACLCDVTVTNPVPIRRDIPHMFHKMALDELGDYQLCERNVVEFFSVVLACHQLWQEELDDSPDRIPVWASSMTARGGETFGPPAWQSLPDDLRARLRVHYRIGSPWRIASVELEGAQIDVADLQQIEKYYLLRRRNNKYTGRNRKGSLGTSECDVCGATIVNARGLRNTCSNKCRSKKRRLRNKAREAELKEQYRED